MKSIKLPAVARTVPLRGMSPAKGCSRRCSKFWRERSLTSPRRAGRKHPNQEFIQINTENILFICGGAFDTLDQIIKKRKGSQTIGFDSEILTKNDKRSQNIYQDVTAHDIVKFGLIPELVGRLPIIVALEALDSDALIRILAEPKNSVLKQYTALIGMDGVELTFDSSALERMAELAIERNTGARGLRAIMEEVMQDIMYEIPSMENITKVTVTAQTVDGTGAPVYS